MTIEEVLQHDLKFRYMLLGRLQADCEYYLGFGNKSSPRNSYSFRVRELSGSTKRKSSSPETNSVDGSLTSTYVPFTL